MYDITFYILDILFMIILIICSITDIKKRIVPNTCIVLLLIISITKIILDSLTGYPWWMHIAGLVYTIPFFALWSKNEMGAGDVKLLIVIPLFLGLFSSLIAFLFMFMILLSYGLYMRVKSKDIHQSIPLAPFISIGFLGFLTLKYCLSFI